MRTNVVSPSFGLANAPITVSSQKFASSQISSKPQAELKQQPAVKFGFGGGLKVAMYGLFAGTILMFTKITEKEEKIDQLKQENYQLKEPTCSKVIKDHDDFNEIVDDAGGRHKIQCDADGYKLITK